jgi:hypothetical protein
MVHEVSYRIPAEPAVHGERVLTECCDGGLVASAPLIMPQAAMRSLIIVHHSDPAWAEPTGISMKGRACSSVA